MEPNQPQIQNDQADTQLPSSSPVSPIISPQTAPMQPPHKKGHAGLIVGIVVAGVVLIGGGVAAFMAYTTTQSRTRQAAETSQSEDAKQSDSAAKEDGPSATIAATCISPDDMTAGFDDYPDTDEDSFNSMNFLVIENIFFLADSAEYEYPDIAAKRLDGLARFYKNNSQKQFMYELSGSTYESSASDAGSVLASERVEKVKQELLSRGVPEDRLSIGEARFSANHESSRNVDITLKKSGNCTVAE